ILIFTFASTFNQNYMGYMLDPYAPLEHECPPEPKEALLNNWMINLAGEVGRWIEGDLMQEHYNSRANLRNFLRMKEDIESAFELKRRSKSHTSPHLLAEIRILLRLYKEEQLHFFRSGRSMSHTTVNRVDHGYWRLDEGKMDQYARLNMFGGHSRNVPTVPF
ncbi:hypothetical protein FB451DRAFT_1031421, partial [Mycena latifolia]